VLMRISTMLFQVKRQLYLPARRINESMARHHAEERNIGYSPKKVWF